MRTTKQLSRGTKVAVRLSMHTAGARFATFHRVLVDQGIASGEALSLVNETHWRASGSLDFLDNGLEITPRNLRIARQVVDEHFRSQ